MTKIVQANTSGDFAAAIPLFTEYAAWLGVDLCFQGFDAELQNISEMYASPKGALLLLKDEEHFFACVGIREKEKEAAELKRMYVQPAYQGKGFGVLLLETALKTATEMGYKKIRLDTLNHMTPAISLYRKLGFYEIDAYYHNPIKGAVYFERKLE
jgi:putative acetyltransferase